MLSARPSCTSGAPPRNGMSRSIAPTRSITLENPAKQAFGPATLINNTCIPRTLVGSPTVVAARTTRITSQSVGTSPSPDKQICCSRCATGFTPGGFNNLDPPMAARAL